MTNLSPQEHQELMSLRRTLIAALGATEDRLGMGRSIPSRAAIRATTMTDQEEKYLDVTEEQG